jgi:uncharacterized membrane protein YfcA
MDEALILAALFLVAAVLYGMVGHAGASAYLAVMGLAGLAPDVMKPTALTLNILVASIVTARFARAGFVRPISALPFLAGSVPAAFLGGALTLPDELYRPLVGAVLLFAAVRFGATAGRPAEEFAPRPPMVAAVASGAVIGLLAGLTGTGGGIFLSPLLLFLGWSATKPASGVAAVFILCNSIAGLLGNMAIVKALPPDLPVYAVAVALGAVLGTTLGIRWSTPMILKALGVVLIIAGLKLIGVY